MLGRDLREARQAWLESSQDAQERERREGTTFLLSVDAAGRHGDFHALRHSAITRWVKSGMNPKEAQALARHSTITLTFDRYTHISLADTAAAMAKVPGIEGTQDRKTKRKAP